MCLEIANALPEIKRADVYGQEGEKQDGIDIECELHDGRIRSIQCRKRKRFTKSSAEKLVKETVYKADEHEVWVTCKTGVEISQFLRRRPEWTIRNAEKLAVRPKNTEPPDAFPRNTSPTRTARSDIYPWQVARTLRRAAVMRHESSGVLVREWAQGMLPAFRLMGVREAIWGCGSVGASVETCRPARTAAGASRPVHAVSQCRVGVGGVSGWQR